MEPEEYEQYETLHRDFSKTYSKVYRYVMDFYPMPQRFIQEMAPEIDKYVEKLSDNTNMPDSSFQTLFSLAKDFKVFAADASDVFEEYKDLQGESGRYIKDVFRLKEKNFDDDMGSAGFVKLIPTLNSLISRFKRVEQKTDENIRRFQQLQNDWRNFKGNTGPERKNAAWPL